MIFLAFFFLLLSAHITLVNWLGWYQAHRRKQRGESGGYSHVPVLSLVFAGFAWLAGRHTFGPWIFVPTALDPGTWLTLLLPFLLPAMFRK